VAFPKVVQEMPAGTREWQVYDHPMPWRMEHSFMEAPDLNVGWGGFGFAACAYGGYRYCFNQNDEIAYDLMLGAGTWEISIAHLASNDEGIGTVSLDGTAIGTFDSYNAGGLTLNLTSIFAGVVVGSSGKKRLSIKSTGKNGASSGYVLAIHGFSLRRTA
jgi:hypothetical protein